MDNITLENLEFLQKRCEGDYLKAMSVAVLTFYLMAKTIGLSEQAMSEIIAKTGEEMRNG